MNKIIKEQLKRLTILRYIYHIPQDIFLLIKAQVHLQKMRHMKVKCGKDLEVFKNIYFGKRCFIIGLGPSLRAQDLKMISGEYCFASNRIFSLFDQTNWRPTFYCTGDPNFPKHVGEKIKEPVMESKYCFLGLAHANLYDKSVIKKENVYFYSTTVGTGVRSIWREKHGYKGKKIDLTKKLDSVGTITYEMIQMALYMGFKEIYLLGVDNCYSGGTNYASSIKPYSDEEKRKMKMIIDTSAWTKGYNDMKRISAQYGCAIKNASRGGALEIFEHVDLEDVIGLGG